MRSKAPARSRLLLDNTSQLKAAEGVDEEACGRSLCKATRASKTAWLFWSLQKLPTLDLQTSGHMPYFRIYRPVSAGGRSRDGVSHDLCLSQTPSRVRMYGTHVYAKKSLACEVRQDRDEENQV